jgi:L-seryl-tRNA(Ser) seleniumtransferase
MEQFGIADHEPTPAESLKGGVDLVCFSGDKLFGGPQAGIIAGKKRLIAALKREPLFRALRCDKLSLAALQATVDLHLNQRTLEIPTLALLRISEDELCTRAAAICDELSRRCSGLQIASGRGSAKTGGGTLPKSNLPSVTIDILPKNSSLADFAAMLRERNPPVIGYISGDRFKLDVRTIFPHQDGLVVEAIHEACVVRR